MRKPCSNKIRCPVVGLAGCHVTENTKNAGTSMSVPIDITDDTLASSLVPVQCASLAPPAIEKTTSFTSIQMFHTHTHTPASTQTSFPTNQPLHKPPFAPANCYKPAFTQIGFYPNQLLDKQPFRQTTFCANQLLQPSFYTHHFYDKLTCCTNQLCTTPALAR